MFITRADFNVMQSNSKQELTLLTNDDLIKIIQRAFPYDKEHTLYQKVITDLSISVDSFLYNLEYSEYNIADLYRNQFYSEILAANTDGCSTVDTVNRIQSSYKRYITILMDVVSISSSSPFANALNHAKVHALNTILDKLQNLVEFIEESYIEIE
jgi:hypothetical protein